MIPFPNRPCLGLLLLLSTAVAPPARGEGGPLTLEDAVGRALATSPTRSAAAARRDAAAADLALAGRLPNPSLEVQVENVTIDHWPAGANPADDVFVLLSQPVEIGGDRAARRDRAAAGHSEAAATRAAVERQVTLETVQQFLAVLRARTLGEILDTNRTDLDHLAGRLELRVADGAAPVGDLMKLRAEIARLDLERTTTRADLAEHRLALGALLDAPDLAAASLVVPEGVAAAAGPAAQTRYDPASRPEIAAARARVAAAGHEVAVERARRIPDISVTAGYKRTDRLDTLVAGVSVPLPVFDRNTDAVARALAAERAAAAELQALDRSLQAESAARLERARALAASARNVDATLLEPARLARDAARAAFREGAANVLQLVDAERTYTDMRRAALDLQLEAFAQTYAAEWTPEEIAP